MTGRPAVHDFTRPFWDAVAEGQLVVPQCRSCERRFFTPEPLCIHCGSPDWAWVTSAGMGEVYSLSVVHQPVNDDFEVPFALCIIDMDDGWSMLSHVIGIPAEQVRIGDRVQFSPTAGGSRPLPTFAFHE
ncbi:MAG: hypothetical protein JWM76_235 [Pseudonocardiales bacterium]|nr:hypothetical protein [Pseudonocardiales bacterium]